MKKARLLVVLAAAMALVLPTAAHASPVKVKIVNYHFKPSKVSISKGQKVVWHNATAGTLHSVTAYKGSWSKDSSVSAGSSTSFTFNQTGTFKYYCKYHAHITAAGKCVANTGISTAMCGVVLVG
jgi:plastocyanin